LTLGDTGSLKVLIEHLVAAAPERKELANLRRLLAHDNKSLAKRNNVTAILEVARDPVAAAKLARLRHVCDDMPGISRHKARNGSVISIR
jgi:hypothetical protein